MDFYLRRMLFYGISIYIFIMYFLRSFILKYDPMQYELQYIPSMKQTYFTFDKLPTQKLVIFIIGLYILVFFCPSKIKIGIIKNIKFFKSVFFVQNILYFVLIVFFSVYTMGQGLNMYQRIIIGLIENLLGRNFLLIIILIQNYINKKNNLLYMIIYLLPSFAIGSKAGIIICGTYYLFMLIGFKKKILRVKFILIGTMGYLLYPYIYHLSWIIRLGIKYDFIKAVNQNYNFLAPLLLLSKRITGVDILMLGTASLEKLKIFNLSYFNIKIISAILSRGILSSILGEDIKPYTVEFSQIIAEQGKNVINTFEPTLFGVFYYSENFIIIYIFFHLVILILVFFLKIFLKDKMNIFFIVIGIQYLELILTGNYPSFFIIFRNIFIFLVLNKFFDTFKNFKV